MDRAHCSRLAPVVIRSKVFRRRRESSVGVPDCSGRHSQRYLARAPPHDPRKRPALKSVTGLPFDREVRVTAGSNYPVLPTVLGCVDIPDS